VFNKDDLELGSAHFVLYETNPSDKTPLRIVPFMDIEGGRLDYLRNDYLYFSHSLLWQRSPPNQKFEDEQATKISETTRQLMHRIARLDTCIIGAPPPRFYTAQVFVRQMITQPQFKVWSPAVNTAEVALVVNEQALELYNKSCRQAFDLPPGHFDTKAREEDTKAGLMQEEGGILWQN
jgi:hypothetical protein